ncbi:MAG: heavy-metal-associated domain-containing protein [Clostridia bacterium]|nr:heavy-metal-associated domain-containing protein [Clostridia bacterium]
MIRITVKVDGMMCGMCEAHVNDAVRKSLTVKKVASNHKKKETVILTEQDIPDDRIIAAIQDSGYDFKSLSRKEVKAGGLFGLFRK